MKRTATTLVLTLAAAWSTFGCGGIASDGGQSGTGLSAIRGNVVAPPGVELDLADIHVSLTDTDLGTRTDASGRFELRARTSGPGELRFERQRDGLFARTAVVIPAGGVLELSEIVLDPESDEARPTMRRVEFEGFVRVLDCAGGAIVVTATEDEVGGVFTIQVASATIRHDQTSLACRDLRVGDRVEVDAATTDGSTLVNAEVVLEDREDEGDDDSEDMPDDAAEIAADEGQP